MRFLGAAFLVAATNLCYSPMAHEPPMVVFITLMYILGGFMLCVDDS